MQMCKPAFETTHSGSKTAFSNSSCDSCSSEYNHQEYSKRGYSMNQHQGHHMGLMHKYPSRNHVAGHGWTGSVSELISNATSIKYSRMPACHGAADGHAFEWSEKREEHATYWAADGEGCRKML